ncbi:MAG: T9SS type A sorting domain-containing protein, partial [Chitinophagaceae bacterium]|nr:T9SS type A sorting domain-containing protein [Chitinophagaceae bacterium]
VQLIDLYGRTVKQMNVQILEGLNEVFLRNLDPLSSGIYALRIQIGERIITKQMLKTNTGY